MEKLSPKELNKEYKEILPTETLFQIINNKDLLLTHIAHLAACMTEAYGIEDMSEILKIGTTIGVLANDGHIENLIEEVCERGFIS